MKTIIIGDFQVYSRRNAFESGRDLLDTSLAHLEKVYEQAKARGVRSIYHAGDFFEHPSPSPYVLNAVISAFKRWAVQYRDIVMYSITGNHDHADGTPESDKDKPNRTILQALAKACPNFVVVDYQQKGLENQCQIVCWPFIRSENDWLAKFREFDPLPDTVLLMHQDTLQQIHDGKREIDEDEVRAKFLYVCNGHVHSRKANGNFLTLGSLMEQKEKDATPTSKGYYVFDSEDKSLIFHELLGYPKFVEYFNDEEVREEDAGNYILRRARPIEVRKRLRKIDDSTPKGREDAGAIFLAEKVGEVEADLETELASLISKVQATNARIKKTIRYGKMVWRGFRSWLDGDYDWQTSGTRYVQGPTGCGKSTVLEAIPWVEYGMLVKEKAKQDHVVPEPWLQNLDPTFQGTMVQLQKFVDGVEYRVTRCLNYKGDVFGQKGNDNFFIHRITDDGPIACTASDFNVSDEDFANKTKRTQAWADWCGIDSTTFMNMVLFTPEKCNLVQAGDAEKRAILEPLLNVDWVDRVKDLAKTEREAEQAELGKVNGELNLLSERIRMTQSSMEEGKARRDRFDASKAEEIVVIDAKIEANTALVPDYQSDIDTAQVKVDEKAKEIDDTISTKIAAANAQRQSKTDGLQGLRHQANVMQAQIDSMKLKDTNEKIALMAEFDKVTRAKIDDENRLLGLQGRIKGVENSVNNLQPVATERLKELEAKAKRLMEVGEDIATRYQVAKFNSSTLKGDLELKTNRLASLQGQTNADPHSCPVCNQELPEGHNILAAHEKHLASIKETEDGIVDVKAKIKDAETLFEVIKAEIVANEQTQREYGNLITSEKALMLATMKQAQAVLETEKVKLQQDAADLNVYVTITLPGQLQDLDLKIKMEQEKEVVDLTSRQQTVRAEIVAKEKEIADYEVEHILPVNTEIAKLQVQLDQQAIYRKELDGLKAELAEARADMQTLISTIENQKQQRLAVEVREFDGRGDTTLQAQLDEANASAEVKQAVKARIERRVANLTQIEKTVCGARGLKTFLIQQKLERLNDYATVYANALGTSIHFGIDDKNSYVTTIVVEGHERDAAKASNGQLLIANLILAGSLYDQQAETVDLGLQMLDEPFGPLDQDTVFAVSQLLGHLSKTRAMHVITHSTSIDMSNADIVRIGGGTKSGSYFVN